MNIQIQTLSVWIYQTPSNANSSLKKKIIRFQQIQLWHRNSIVFQEAWKIKDEYFPLLIANGHKKRNLGWVLKTEKQLKLDFMFNSEAKKAHLKKMNVDSVW